MVKGEPLRFIQGHQNRLRAGITVKEDRFLVTDRGFETPCWVWLLATGPTGYGQEWDHARHRMVGAHILSYERINGPVPPGLELHHVCMVRDCLNPAHLEAVTHSENISRSDYRTNNANARKTHCPQGHEYSGENLVYENGSRRCKQCRRDRRRAAQ